MKMTFVPIQKNNHDHENHDEITKYILKRAPKWADTYSFTRIDWCSNNEFERKILMSMSEKYISIEINAIELGIKDSNLSFKITYVKLK